MKFFFILATLASSDRALQRGEVKARVHNATLVQIAIIASVHHDTNFWVMTYITFTSPENS